MWRPFASNFTKNTYMNFLKNFNRSPVRKKPKEITKQVEENKGDRLLELQNKVRRQRLLIKQRDHLHLAKQRRLKERYHSKIMQNFNMKKEYNLKIRAMANNKITRHRSYTPNYVAKPPPQKPNKSGIFSLTAARSSTKKIRTQRPLIPVGKYQEKLLKQFKDPELRRKVQSEFDIITGVRKRKHQVSVFPDINSIRNVRIRY